MSDDAGQLTERERNRLLRRVDWRFLLAHPVLGRVLCLGDGELCAGCRLVATQVDDAIIGAVHLYDVVAAQDPVDRTLAMAFDRLVAGGELYAEWRTSADSAAIRSRLATAGFIDVRLYWPWPAPPDAEVWVPLDVPAAFDRYLTADRHVYSGWRHRVGTRARRLAARWRFASGRATPLCALARTPPPAAGRLTSGAAVLEAVRGAGGVPDRTVRLTSALLTGGPRAISKVVGLVYPERGAGPAFAVKWPRVKESEAGLLREAEALAASHANGVAAGVPRLLALTGTGAELAVAESAARGAPMFTRVSRATGVKLARQGASWLADFHAAQERSTHDAASWSTRADQALARFADTFGATVDARLLDETATLLSTGAAAPSVIEHRDFGPWNILVDDAGALTVLDWESSRVHGLPLLDLIYFTTYMAFFMDGAMVSRRFDESYRSTLDARSATGAIRRELMERYKERFRISLEAERALRALCWIEHAESEFQHFTADAGGRPTRDALGASVFVRLWKEEIIALRG